MALSKISSAALQQVRASKPIRLSSKNITKRPLHHRPRMDRSNYFLGNNAFPRLYSSGPSQDPGAGTRNLIWAVIGVNVAVFGTWHYAKSKQDRKLLKQLQDHATLSWRNIDQGRYHTVLTSAFSQLHLNHLLFNMFGLFVYGGILASRALPPATTLALTLGCAVAGSGAWLYEHRYERRRVEPAQDGFLSRVSQPHAPAISSALGASGIVMGVAGAATCVAPFTPMAFILIPIHFPLFLWTIGYVGLDIWYMDPASKIGHSAHLGGTAFGVLFYLLRLRRFGGVASILGRR